MARWETAPGILLGYGVDRTPPLDARRSPALPVGKGGYGARLVLEGRLHRALELRRVAVQVDEVDVSLGRRDDEQAAGRVHGVDAIGAIEHGQSFSGLAEIPVPDCPVPRARGDDGARGRRDIDEADGAHRRGVRPDDACLPRRAVKQAGLFVGAGRCDEGSILHSL